MYLKLVIFLGSLFSISCQIETIEITQNGLEKKVGLAEDDGYYNRIDLLYSFYKISKNSESRGLRDCLIENCEKCSSNNCTKCNTGYVFKKNSCVINEKNIPQNISLKLLSGIIVFCVLFLTLFCVVCIYYARKYRHKYSEFPSIDGEITKMSSVNSRREENLTDISNHYISPNVFYLNIDRDFRNSSDMGLDNVENQLSLRGKEKTCPLCFEECIGNNVETCCGFSVHVRCFEEITRIIGNFCPACRRTLNNEL